MNAKERELLNKEILDMYFKDDLSTYQIANKLTQKYKRLFYPPNIFRVIKRDYLKYGYTYDA